MRVTCVSGRSAAARRSFALGASVMAVAAGAAGCGGATTSAYVSNCLSSSLVSFERTQGEPRTDQNLELTVSCDPKRPFELSEVSESGDYPVLAVQHGGTDTCLHRQLKAKGEKCAIQVSFEPKNGPGQYATEIFFQYAGENETFIARVSGSIAAA
jgi:hypothetical protein